mmetsp:Transcript_32056/g.44443  ORF Transcript_32056/g.44443 Transcript_32056/m.44443 type:complete len:92 (-) Transcript_32056:15-290(-)
MVGQPAFGYNPVSSDVSTDCELITTPLFMETDLPKRTERATLAGAASRAGAMLLEHDERLLEPATAAVEGSEMVFIMSEYIFDKKWEGGGV